MCDLFTLLQQIIFSISFLQTDSVLFSVSSAADLEAEIAQEEGDSCGV